MTRTDVRKLAWILRLIGLGMLGGAAALMLLGAGRVSAPTPMPPIAGLHGAPVQTAGVSR